MERKANNIYLVYDGIPNVGCVKGVDGLFCKNTNYYLISYDFKSNHGYIEKKAEDSWKLYTSIGPVSIPMESRYHFCSSFEECVAKLKELSEGCNIVKCFYV
jgi:hypothetical protein